jgi:hypothetical protein
MAIAITERRLIWQYFLCSENIRLKLLKKLAEIEQKRLLAPSKSLAASNSI